MLKFNQGYTLRCDFLDGAIEARTGTWGLVGDTVMILLCTRVLSGMMTILDGQLRKGRGR